MQTVSADYKAQIRQLLRNPSYIKIEFGIVDPQAPSDASISDNGGAYYSSSSDISYYYEVIDSYNTLEHNRFILDGAHAFPPKSGETPYVYQGYVGDRVSGQDGYFETPSVVTIDFLTTYFTFVGLTLNFDTVFGEHPRELNIIAYNDSVEVYNETRVTDQATNYVWEDSIPECNKIELISTRTGYGQRRFRLENVVFGIMKTFDNEDIETATWKRETDLINYKLPTHSFNFTIIDKDRAYDPELSGGIFAYLEEQQPINFQFGYELNDGSIEWIQGGNTFTSGEVSVTTEATIPKVSFKSVSTLSYLTKIYDEGLYYPSTGRSLYDLATDVLTFSQIPLNSDGGVRWSIDSSLASIYTMTPLPKLEVRSILQLIANAGRCVLDVDRNGNIQLEQHSSTVQDFIFTLGDIKNPPKTKKYPTLMGVDTSFTTVTMDDTISELGQFDVLSANATLLELEYELAYNVTATIGSGLTLVGTPEYFANMCRLVVTGTGIITLNGYKLNLTTQNVAKEFNLTGERCSISNSLLSNYADAMAYATWVGNYINRRNEYGIEDRGFPELDSGDEIAIDTLFTEDVGVTLIGTEITFNGAISGKSKLLIRGSE